MTLSTPSPFVQALVDLVGPERVILDPQEQRRHLFDRNFTLYSALLTDAFADRHVDAIARPATVDELRGITALAVRYRVPITVRGAGLTTYGQSLPLEGGLLIDIRDLDRVLEITDGGVTVEPGATLAAAEAAARARGRELRLFPSNLHVATAAGYVAGGSAGIGSVRHGFLWDGNVLGVEALTAEDPPRPVRLIGPDVNLVIHAYGVTGVITRLTFPVEPARAWRDACVTFDSFDDAARFAYRLAAEATVSLRLCSLQQAPIPRFFLPVQHLFPAGSSAVLLMVEDGHADQLAQLAGEAGGQLRWWPEKPSITQFVFNHSVLWARKRHPNASWVQLVFSEEGLFEQLAALTSRFGHTMFQHVEMVRRPDGSITPFGRSVILDPDLATTARIMEACRGLGIHVINPHSYVLEEIGMSRMAADPAAVAAFKAQVDPLDLLNRGKIGRAFYGPHAGRTA